MPNDPSQTVYVWLDALTNYLTAAGYPNSNYTNLWPADYHIIGKDILAFHGIYWPAFLMAANIELPKKLIVHGHWTVNKVKMSKSLGNVVSPDTIIDKYGVDVVRLFLLSEGGLENDGDFSEEKLKAKLNNVLANALGNLVGRITGMALNPQNSWPSTCEPTEKDQELIQKINNIYGKSKN